MHGVYRIRPVEILFTHSTRPRNLNRKMRNHKIKAFKLNNIQFGRNN